MTYPEASPIKASGNSVTEIWTIDFRIVPGCGTIAKLVLVSRGPPFPYDSGQWYDDGLLQCSELCNCR